MSMILPAFGGAAPANEVSSFPEYNTKNTKINLWANSVCSANAFSQVDSLMFASGAVSSVQQLLLISSDKMNYLKAVPARKPSQSLTSIPSVF
jgi:hypothetical protein